jgi:hypothetical protein
LILRRGRWDAGLVEMTQVSAKFLDFGLVVLNLRGLLPQCYLLLFICYRIGEDITYTEIIFIHSVLSLET